MYKKISIILTIAFIISLSSLSVFAEGVLLGDIPEDKTLRKYADGDKKNAIDTVAKFIKLNLAYEDFDDLNSWLSKQPQAVKNLYYEWYPIRTVVMKENYTGDSNYGQTFNIPIFLWDGISSEPYDNSPITIRTPFEYVDLSLLHQNNQTTLGKTGRYRILGEINLKAPEFGNTGTSYITISGSHLVSHIDSSGNGWVNTGYVPYGEESTYPYNYSGKVSVMEKADWRYMGFSQFGEQIPSPVMALDGGNSSLNGKSFIDTPWIKLSHIVGNEPPYIQRLMGTDLTIYEMFYSELFKEYPELIDMAVANGYNTDNAYQYWQPKLLWYTNPLVSTGVAQGWHKEMKDGVEHYYYLTFQTPAPSTDNVAINELVITEKNSGKVVDVLKRDDEGDVYSQYENEGKTVFLDKEVTYLATAKVVYLKGEFSNDYVTTHTPATLHFANDIDYTGIEAIRAVDRRVTNYESVYQSAYANYYNNYQENRTTNNHGQLTHNEPVLFEYEFTVDDTTLDSFSVLAKVDNGYSAMGDDYNDSDNFMGYDYGLALNDMQADGDVRLYDHDGNEIQSILVDEYYAIEVTVSKPMGSKPVEDTMVDLFIDYGNGEAKHIETSDQILNKDGTITIRTDYIVAPTTGTVTIRGIIDKKHNIKNENVDLTNDEWEPKTFVALSNFTIKDFKVVPQSINYGKTQTFPVSETINLEATLLNENEMKQVRDVDVVIKQNGTTVKTVRVTLPADVEQTFIWNINTSISNGGGSNFNVGYSVEINPVKNGKREYVEYVNTTSNPYLDNYKENALTVFRTPYTTYECEVVDTYNSWTQSFTEYEWRGHRVYYTYYVSVPSGTGYASFTVNGVTYGYSYTTYTSEPRTGSYCSTDSTWYNYPNYTHYERFEITNIYFKSKVTTDNYGGWVDVLSSPSRAKIKSGYGFEMKVVTKYTTNVVSSRPSAWTSGCSGMSYSPTGYHVVTVTKNMTVTMPYKDNHGDYMQFNLDITDTSGSWASYTQTFEMPLRNSFGVKDERKIYIGEDVKVGDYPIRIDTDEFYGSPDKPSISGYNGLCDKETFYIHVIGGMEDDTNTHIVE